MEKYKYCNMGRARELSSGGREGGRQEGRGGDLAQKGRGDKSFISLAGGGMGEDRYLRNAAFG